MPSTILAEDFELFDFDICKDCIEAKFEMSVPQGAHAAFKVRKNMERTDLQYNMKQEAANYNSKYMNSIWGMYNRFSVHNLKKVMDTNQPQPIGQSMKNVGAGKFSVSMEKLSHLPL
ncbi:hypothetical protein GWI33_008900 [Rhynchophorus ferrugineus]|uniref:Uncharacterized protein n=1 Tax=Rhynchophorus ferrugineus TaxID=354439 RepID=A0A834J273_RHYFE|nr:hypothetical protein GWI33_008900 [Rhynchophorus ferrugineus]